MTEPRKEEDPETHPEEKTAVFEVLAHDVVEGGDTTGDASQQQQLGLGGNPPEPTQTLYKTYWICQSIWSVVSLKGRIDP